jgi:hypothetical protein
LTGIYNREFFEQNMEIYNEHTDVPAAKESILLKNAHTIFFLEKYSVQ